MFGAASILSGLSKRLTRLCNYELKVLDNVRLIHCSTIFNVRFKGKLFIANICLVGPLRAYMIFEYRIGLMPTVHLALSYIIWFFSFALQLQVPIYSLKKCTKILIEIKDHRPLQFGQRCGVVLNPHQNPSVLVCPTGTFLIGSRYRFPLYLKCLVPVPRYFTSRYRHQCQVPTLNSGTDARYWYRHQVPVLTFGSLRVQGLIKSQRRTAVK